MSQDKRTRPDSQDPTSADTSEWQTPGASPVPAPDEVDAEEPTPVAPSFVDQTAVEAPSPTELNVISGMQSAKLPFDFGRYRMLEVLGQGGAGVVYLARKIDADSGQPVDAPVAVKLIRPEILANSKAVQRFEKEARLHAQIRSPFINQMIEFGNKAGIYFIASEFVEGVTLTKLVSSLAAQDEKVSLRIIRDVLTALATMHQAGLIHRDVKPANVIVDCDQAGDNEMSGFDLAHYRVAKLTDFGLARQLDQSESMAMTQQHTVLGTPLYMAPEQHYESRSVDARADVYSTGITLYQMLSGELPFSGADAMALAEQHRDEQPRPLKLVVPQVSEAVSNLVGKALEKDPNLRYQNAQAMLDDVNQILDDQPISLRVYPTTPDDGHAEVMHFDFEWDLDAPLHRLWELVADTNRFNRALGLPAPDFQVEQHGDGNQTYAETRFLGMKIRWREFPFQWVRGREMSVLRVFESGPFEWVTSTVFLQSKVGQRTRLIHRFQVLPRGRLGRMVAGFQFGKATRKDLNRVYQQLEKLAASDQPFAMDQDFSTETRMKRQQRRRLQDGIAALAAVTKNQALAEQFGRYLESAADPLVARLRPLELGDKLGCSDEQALELCFHGAEAGLLNLQWDVICPVCRVASQTRATLENVGDHEDCQVCQLEYEVDFAKSVELIFGVHPQVRNADTRTYCIGGPYHAPHVLAQNRLLAGQAVEFATDMDRGRYQVTGPQLNRSLNIHVADEFTEHRIDFGFGKSFSPEPLPLHVGTAVFHLDNQSNQEIVLRLEQSSEPYRSITAAQASQLKLFQKLFPREVVSPEELVEVTHVYLLGIALPAADQLADQHGEIALNQHWTQVHHLLQSAAETELTVVDSSYDRTVIAFETPQRLRQSLVQFLQSSEQLEPEFNHPGQHCLVIHSGPLMLEKHRTDQAAHGPAVRQIRRRLERGHAASLQVLEQLAQTDEIQDLLESFSRVNSPPEDSKDSSNESFVWYEFH